MSKFLKIFPDWHAYKEERCKDFLLDEAPCKKQSLDCAENEEDCQEVLAQANPWIADVDSCIRNDRKSVMEVANTEQDWERITLKIDSGAVDTVMPPTVGKHFPLEETERSRKGEGYLAANNSVIPHYGMRKP